MREILFRGKSERSGEWVYGSLIVTHGGCVIYSKYHPLVTAPPEKQGDYLNQYVVDPRTVGQYTGLTDKNGKKIFEGDIIECISCGKPYRDVVVCGRWNCSCCDGVYGYALLHYEERLDFREVKGYEICGNIHDNPELLEVKEWTY